MPEDSRQPIVSILMAAYNQAPYISRAVEGVLAQKTEFPYELIIGEDCSADGTRQIVLDYQRRFPGVIRVVMSDTNVGLHENESRTRRAARGKYVAYCEGDDYWHDPRKLQLQVAFMEQHPEYSLTHSNCRWHYEATGILVTEGFGFSALQDDNAYAELLIGRRVVATVTACARTDLLNQITADCPECRDKRFLMGDMQIWLELARRGKVHYFRESLGTRSFLSESVTQSRDPRKVLRFALSLRELMYHYLAKYDCPEAVARRAKMGANLNVLIKACRARDKALAADAYKEYQALRGEFSPSAWFYYQSSRSALSGRVLRPYLIGYMVIHDILRRPSRFFRHRGWKTILSEI